MATNRRPDVTVCITVPGVPDGLTAWRRLRQAGHDAWLLESAGSHPEAVRSILGALPVARLVLEGARGRIEAEGAPPRHGPARQLLESFVAQHTGTSGESGFTGGIMGWLGFETVHLWMPGLPPSPSRDMPDAILRAFDAGIIVQEGSARVHATSMEDAATLARALGYEGGAAPVGAGSGRAPATRAGRPPVPAPPNTAEGGTATPAWDASMDEHAFRQQLDRIQDLIAQGDLFQANIATRFEATAGDALRPDILLERLRHANPGPFMALLPDPDATVASASPELLFAVEQAMVRARPIAGTRPRHPEDAQDRRLAADLCHDPKEQAEHMMLVDLVRNDVAQVAVPGTVRVRRFQSVERYRHVMHLVSEVEGAVRPGTGVLDWLGALFPGGTVTGAPKRRAVQRIIEAEPVARGPYTGSAGWIGRGGQTCWNILIRTLVCRGDRVRIHAGAGIVADSRAASEWQEVGHKARALLEAAEGADRPGGSRSRIGEVEARRSWEPPAPLRTFPDARVLVVDNEDSFVHNLADYAAAMGAQVRVVGCHTDVEDTIRTWDPTHVMLSPGPGRPEDAGATPRLAATLRDRPLLGVCLGHQALGLACGAPVVQGPAVHGKTSMVHHAGAGLLVGMPSPFEAARYHSLQVERSGIRPPWRVDAWLDDGTVMAIGHQDAPVWGVQFHPESMGTQQGMAIVASFLAKRTGPAMKAVTAAGEADG